MRRILLYLPSAAAAGTLPRRRPGGLVRGVLPPANAPSSLSPDEAARLPARDTTGTASTSPIRSSPSGPTRCNGRGLCPLHCADLRPSDRRFADRLADAPRLPLRARCSTTSRCSPSRCSTIPTRRCATTSSISPCCRRSCGARGTTNTNASPRSTIWRWPCRTAGASGQRFPLYARLGRLGKPSTGCMPNTSCCSSTTPAVRCAARSARRSPRRRCSRR